MLSNSQQPHIQFGSILVCDAHFSQSNQFSKDKITTNTTFFTISKTFKKYFELVYILKSQPETCYTI